MIRGLPKRAVALLGTLFFLLTTAGEGFGLHPCPYHDSLHGETAAAETGDPQHQHHQHHPEHHEASEQHAAHAAPDSGAASHGHHSDAEPCTHVEACQPTSGAAAPEYHADGLTWVFRTADEPIVASATWFAASFPPHFLPYAQAPPVRG